MFPHLVLVASILLRLSATGLSLATLQRTRDWRVGLFTVTLALMTIRQVITLAIHLSGGTAHPRTGHIEEIPGLAVSILALLAALGLDRFLAERAHVEHELRKSESRSQAILDGIPDLVFRIRRDGTIVDYRAPESDLLARPRHDIRGRHLESVDLPALLTDHVRSAMETALATGHVQTREYELDVPRGRRTFEARIVPSGPDEVLYISRDITERRETEDRLHQYQRRLQALAAELSMAEERERQRIAAGLHDVTLQSLAVAQLKLGELRRALGDRHQVAMIDEIRRLTERAIEETRLLTFELSPPVLHELGLGAAFEWLAEQSQKKHDLSCTVAGQNAIPRLDKDLETFLFRSVRELLTNAIRHARAGHIRISTEEIENDIVVTVADNGIGFDPVASEPGDASAGGFGLFSIRERLGSFGGTLEVDSAPGRGTRVTLRVPVRPAVAAAAPAVT